MATWATTHELAHLSNNEAVRCARLQGQEDPPLNARGVLQAAALAAALQGEPLARIYTSDLRRALHTAQALASALGHGQDAVVALPSLRERHLGDLQARRAERPLIAGRQALLRKLLARGRPPCAWQGLTRREAAAKQPDAYAALVSTDAAAAPPGGESVGQLRSRCTAGAATPRLFLDGCLQRQALAASADKLWARGSPRLCTDAAYQCCPPNFLPTNS